MVQTVTFAPKFSGVTTAIGKAAYMAGGTVFWLGFYFMEIISIHGLHQAFH